ncbi:glycosyl hydrolase family 61-domain-containing protein [Aspergillus tetrazonus]
MSLFKFAAFVLGTAGSVAGHGYVTKIDVDGTTYGGYLVDTYSYEPDPPKLIAWSTTATDTGYVSPSAYGNSDIVCHRGAEPGALSAETLPGGSVTLYWNTWPTDHHGPVITYLANCNGDCASVDKSTLEFFKVDAGGLVDNSAAPGTWATDELIAADFSRTVTIPSDIASGNYVLRHEIIALHSAGNKDGAQNYPQCINLKITGSGTATPTGTLGTELYKDTDAGIDVNIWNALSSYIIPGPALYTSGSDSNTATSGASSPSTNSSPTTTAAEATMTLSTVVTSAQSTSATVVAEQTSVSFSQTPWPSSTAIEATSASSSAGGRNNGHSGTHDEAGHCPAHTGKKRSRLNRRRSVKSRRHARGPSV